MRGGGYRGMFYNTGFLDGINWVEEFSLYAYSPKRTPAALSGLFLSGYECLFLTGRARWLVCASSAFCFPITQAFNSSYNLLGLTYKIMFNLKEVNLFFFRAQRAHMSRARQRLPGGRATLVALDHAPRPWPIRGFIYPPGTPPGTSPKPCFKNAGAGPQRGGRGRRPLPPAFCAAWASWPWAPGPPGR